jgi:tRNA threonylcarbamoyl adenosine modification protein YeaZ
MIVAALDTSLPHFSVALSTDEQPLGCVVLRGAESRNEKLLPALDFLLTESGIDRGDIDLFAVTRGPGSFTGVRVGLATAHGLALGLGRRVVTVPTFRAIASAWPEETVTVTLAAGRGEIYAATFGPAATETEHLLVPLGSEGGCGNRCVDAAEFAANRSVATLVAAIALRIAASGTVDQNSDPAPLYVRLSAAEEKLLQR